MFSLQKKSIMHRLQERFSKLILEVSTDYHRYMYNKIDWNNRMIGLTGPRVLFCRPSSSGPGRQFCETGWEISVYR